MFYGFTSASTDFQFCQATVVRVSALNSVTFIAQSGTLGAAVTMHPSVHLVLTRTNYMEEIENDSLSRVSNQI